MAKKRSSKQPDADDEYYEINALREFARHASYGRSARGDLGNIGLSWFQGKGCPHDSYDDVVLRGWDIDLHGWLQHHLHAHPWRV